MKSVPPTPNTPRQKRKTLGKAIGNPSYGTNEQIWDKLVELGFFPAYPICSGCKRPLVVRTYRPKLHFSVRCTHPDCRKTNGLLDGSYLLGVNNIRKFFAAATTFVSNSKVCVLKAQTGLAAETWSDYKFKLQTTVNETLKKMKDQGQMMLRGPGKIVEVDECKLHSSKYHRGHQPATDKLWVVGIVERELDGSGLRRSAFLLTENRSSAVLVPFIREWVVPETIIITDRCKGYSDVLKEDFFRDTVVYEYEFAHEAEVDGLEFSSNTNHIEREWVEIRKAVTFKRGFSLPRRVEQGDLPNPVLGW